MLKIGIVCGMLGLALAIVFLGGKASDAFVYSKLVDEVLAQPDVFVGRELRVEGDLKLGSVRFRDDPCEWRFTLVKGPREMPVRFPQCVVPDTFRDGRELAVTVQGRLQPDESFVASQVIPRCPSKYEMAESEQRGQPKPH